MPDDMTGIAWRHVWTCGLRGEGPCSGTWALSRGATYQSNPTSPLTDTLGWGTNFFSSYPDGKLGGDFEPRGAGVFERADMHHHSGGETNLLVWRTRRPPVYPPAEEDILIIGVGHLSYNLNNTGVPQDVVFEGTDMRTGKRWQLIQYAPTARLLTMQSDPKWQARKMFVGNPDYSFQPVKLYVET